MTPQLSRQAVSVVLRGAFGPALFQPQWLSNQNLIRSEETEDATIGVISNPVTQFRVGWLELFVTEDRFQAKTAQEQFYEVLRDVVVGILEILKPANLHMVGINREFLYEVDSERAWHSVQRVLVPPSAWEEVLAQPDMSRIDMRGQRTDGGAGYVRVLVQRSPQVSYGLAIEVNDHYDLDHVRPGHGQAIDILMQNWRESLDQASVSAERIANLGADR